MFLFIFERVREHASRGGAEREGDTESKAGSVQAPSCQHRTWHGAWTSKLWNHDLSRSQTLNQRSHPGTWMFIYFLREGEHARTRVHRWGRGREWGKHRIRSRRQALSCQHRARRRAQTHDPWDHDLSQSWLLTQLSHPGAPTSLF